jgi:hypothetical protein
MIGINGGLGILRVREIQIDLLVNGRGQTPRGGCCSSSHWYGDMLGLLQDSWGVVRVPEQKRNNVTILERNSTHHVPII